MTVDLVPAEPAILATCDSAVDQSIEESFMANLESYHVVSVINFKRKQQQRQ